MNDELPRQKPEPVPALHPVWEYRVSGERAELYAEVKRVLQVPWVGVLVLAYAHYPAFTAELWRGLRPLAGSRPYVTEAQSLRQGVERDVAALHPPPIAERLADAGFSDRERGEILGIIDVLSHGNFLYVLLGTIARLLMEGGEFGIGTHGEPFPGRHAPQDPPPLVLMEPHHVDAPTREVYADVKARLGLPFVNTDYRALARWPSYFAMAWGDLREAVGTDEHEALADTFHQRAVAAVERLPNPGGLTGEGLRAAARADGAAEEILEVCRLFQWLLPGLVTNVAYFRRQLLAGR